MATQDDSIDTSQLKSYALQLDSNTVRQTFEGDADERNHAKYGRRVSGHVLVTAPIAIKQTAMSGGEDANDRDRSNVAGSMKQNESPEVRMQINGTPSQGDTQPASPWVYEKCAVRFSDGPEMEDELARGDRNASSMHPNGMITEEYTEEIDLIGEYDKVPPIHTSQGTQMLELCEDDEMDILSQEIRAEVFPKSQPFRTPKTPGAYGLKRKRVLHRPSQSAETPEAPINPFGNRYDTGLLNPSQMFNTTQALTSPLGELSDLPFERPSPDLYNMQALPMVETPSSPVTSPRHAYTRHIQEPQTKYVSLRESQEQREERLAALRSDSIRSPESYEDDAFASIDTQTRQLISRKKIDDAARLQFAGITAKHSHSHSQPPSTVHKGRSHSKSLPRATRLPQSSPIGLSVRKRNNPVLISDDMPSEGSDAHGSEAETEIGDDSTDIKDMDEVDELADENKENVHVPATVSRFHRAAPHIVRSQDSPSVRSRGQQTAVNGMRSTIPESSSYKESRSPNRSAPSPPLSETLAVADSQSSQRDQSHARAPSQEGHGKANALGSSSDSRMMIPQSQPTQPTGVIESIDNLISQKKHNDTVTEQRPRPFGDEDPDAASYSMSTDHEVRAPTLNNTSLTPPRQDAPVDFAPNSKSRSSREQSIANGSMTSTLYETAKDRMPMISPKYASPRHGQFISENSRSTAASPSKSNPLRSMAEIFAEPSPLDAASYVDIDISILNDDDVEFQKAVASSSPPIPSTRPRRRTGKALSTPTKSGVVAAPVPSPAQNFRTPQSPGSSAYSILTPPASSFEDAPAKVAEAVSRPEENDLNFKPHEIMPVDSVEGEGDATDLHGLEEVQPQTRTQAPIPEQSASNTAEAMSKSVIAPNRCFAHFNGTVSAFYPATCMVIIHSAEPKYVVSFDDGTRDTIGSFGIKRLELRPGDVCKVDLPGARTKNFVVVQLQDGVNEADAAETETDIYGHTNVLVTPRARKSHGDDEEQEEEEGEKTISVPISNVYITQTQWTAIKDRAFTTRARKPKAVSGLHTPVDRPATPSTPSSRALRIKGHALGPDRNHSDFASRHGGLFENAVFGLTNISGTEGSESVKSLILSNGGRVLDDGFDELFDVPALELAGQKTSTGNSPESEQFGLKESCQTIGFTCLVADRHCRRAKYIQALALGIPCLATRWISDSIARSTLLPIAPYLLPAGESTFLGGAVRSRVFDTLPDPKTASLASMVSSRPRYLLDTSVLLTMQKNQEESMRHHNFLTHALGASGVRKVVSVDAAARILQETTRARQVKASRKEGHAVASCAARWDYVYVHDKAIGPKQMLSDQIKKQHGHTKHVKSKKSQASSNMNSGNEEQRWTKVIGNEFLIQSLILGSLVEE